VRHEASPPLVAVLLISAAALAYEVMLMRLFSIIQWHHFAYMVISLALLGYGVSGTFLTLARQRLVPHFTTAFVVNALLFGISSILCFLLVQKLPFNTLELFWDRGQWRYLFLSYLLLFIPFFFAANCICLAFAAFGSQIPRIYAFDLLGAGLGALGVILALYLFAPNLGLKWVAALGMLAALLAALRGPQRQRRLIASVLALLTLSTLALPNGWLSLQLSEYKALSQTLQMKGTKLLEERSSPLGLLSIVASPEVPLRLAPGLSLNNRQEPPAQLGLFVDGDAPTPINRFQGDLEPFGYLDYQTSALPYHLGQAKEVLILGMGGGSGLLQAALHEVSRIDAVELDPQVAKLLQQDYADYAGWEYLAPRVQIHLSEARGYLSSIRERYDLIQISLLDSASAASGGVYGLAESYLYTREAIAEYLGHLTPDGLLSITRWVKIPPRDGLKLLATGIEALRLQGIERPERHLILIRGWDTSTLVLKNQPFEVSQIQRLLTFCEERAFDPAYYPGITASQTNRYNILPEPYFYQGALALLGDNPERYLDQYKFMIQPASDDRPYFFNFFKWSTLPEILSIYREGGFSLLELGYPVLVLTLLQAVLASVILILIPILWLRRQRQTRATGRTGAVLLYFLAIGLGFMFIEIVFIQKFILFLAHPIQAVTVILCGFLIFSGLGSLYAQHLHDAHKNHRILTIVTLLAIISLGYLVLLPPLFAGLSSLSALAKAGITWVLIAPLAFCMGMPFPLGLSRVTQHAPRLLPWAWGVNGCASLISAILATLLAIHLGFTWVVLLALAAYLGAGLLYPALADGQPAH
jgi:hypothetical protein